MLTVCPNCSTSSGVEIAILQSFSGWMRQARCRYCQLVWQAELSSADKLLLVADALAPAPPPIAATPQVALEAPSASLQQFGCSATSGLDEFEPSKDVWTPARLPAAMQVEQSAAAHIAPEVGSDPAAVIARGASWCTSWRLPLSYLQLAVLGLAIADAAIIGWRADLVRVMPQTAGFYARLGLPVNVRGLRFDSFAATAQWRDGTPVLVVKGAISNTTSKAEEVPQLHLVARNGEHQQVYSWATPLARQALAPGETMPFSSELTLPPLDTREIMVRFGDRGDSL
ncbi:MAG: hypothetical protein ACTHJS_10835 [Xanthobacteraceae bacterium]